MWQVGDWAWSQAHQQYVKVIESAGLWGQQFYRVWLQQQDVVLKVLDTDLYNQPVQTIMTADTLCYLATAAKIANVQQEDTLLAPIESNVIPLPHQLKALTKAMSKKQVRYLFADEVGLGKTIEAGLVMRELKLRGLVKRILVCAPKGLVSQWVSEMQTHFNESFQLMLPGEQKLQNEHDNIWSRYDQVVCPIDSIKPIESRKGWSLKQLNEYNKLRFDDLLAASWDLIIIDEAHRLGGSTDQVARYKLGQGLAEAAPYLLLLSATPHQGKSDAFHRLMALLDAEAFPDVSSVSQERVQPFVVRTEKRIAIDGEGKPLFCPRQTEMVAVAWQAQHGLQRHLYEEVTEYIKEGYNQAQAKQQNAIGFLMILMQRLVSSSSAAIARTLARRLKVLENKRAEEELPLAFADEWADLDGQTQLDELLAQCQTSLENEKKRSAPFASVSRAMCKCRK
ncbi:DEAD/DEAH box helicase [Morganella morganii]|uniref:DEAD/DEAH box helicase n=1 Tax=Morganella morganii TaxID=582 RepID=UPI0030FE1CB3